METSDPFAGGVETPADDPFADKPDEGSFAQDDPFAEAGDQPSAEPVPGVPVVDAEGNPVAPPTEESAAEPATQVAPPEEASSAASSEAEAREQAEADAAAEDAASEFERTVPASVDAAAEGPTSLSTSADGAASSNGEAPDGVLDGATSVETPAPAAPDDEEAQERANETENGKVVKRAYRLFSPDGSGKWREVTWYEDKEGKLAEKGAPGARKQNTCVVRGQAEALRVGWRAMGQPQEGCKLVAVSANNFRVRHVGPEVKPEPRVKLAIS